MRHLISCTYCPAFRPANVSWSSLLRQSCFFLTPACLGWRHSCCCCCTCVILVLCSLRSLAVFELILVNIVVAILAIWKTGIVPCNLTRCLNFLLVPLFLPVTRLLFAFVWSDSVVVPGDLSLLVAATGDLKAETALITSASFLSM